MGFLDKIKNGMKDIAESNSRKSSSGYLGSVKWNERVTSVSFVPNINIEGDLCVIYAPKQEDYFFKKEDIESYEVDRDCNRTISHNNIEVPVYIYRLKFKDGKIADASVMIDKSILFDKFLNS